MQIFIKSPSGYVYTIDCEPSDTIEIIKSKIEEATSFKCLYYERTKKNQTPKDIIENPLERYDDGILQENLVLYYGLDNMKDNRTLADYGIQDGSEISLSRRLRGGGIPLNFVNVEKGVVQNLSFSSKAPEWRSVEKGLNLFGNCQNKECKAFKKEVIHKVGIPHKKFNIQENILNIKCPICDGLIVPKTCGFWDCEYQFEGDKIEDGKLKHINIKCKETQGDKFEYFNPFDNGSSLWTNLNIYVIEKQKLKYMIL